MASQNRKHGGSNGVTPLNFTYSHASGEFVQFREAIIKHVVDHDRELRAALVHDDPGNPVPTKAMIRQQYLAAIQEAKDENPGADVKVINELAKMTIDEDRSLFVRKQKSVVEPHIFELVYGDFDNPTKAEWKNFDNQDIYSQSRNFEELWEWVVNPFIETSGAVGARNVVRQHMQSVIDTLGKNERIRTYYGTPAGEK
jgi:hypothetical protein